MTDARISIVQPSTTHHELTQALGGFREQVFAAYPELHAHYAFNLALERKQYFHALCDIKRASRGVWGGGYRDVIRVLECVVDKQFALADKETFRDSSSSVAS